MSDNRSAADEEIMRLATADDDGGEQSEPLELGGEEAPEATPEQVEAEKEKKRSRPWQQRVDILTARLRETERENAELRTRGGAEQVVEEKAPDPNDDKYEFGEADPKFIADQIRHEMRQEAAAERAKAKEADERTRAQQQIVGKLHDGMASIEKAGPEKYDDFEAKVKEAVEARGGEPLPPLVSIGIAVSPAGADIAYRLATDEAASDKLEKLAQSNPQQAAIAFGELEGQYLDNDDDADLDPRDPMDMARMLGRERARRKGLNKAPVERKTTKAQAPEVKARGGNGQLEVDDSTEDFASFERKHMGKRG